MAELFAEIRKSNPYPRQKGGRFGFATGAARMQSDFDPFEAFMGEVKRYESMTPEERAAEEKAQSAARGSAVREEKRREKDAQKKLDASTDFEDVPDTYKAPGIKTDGDISKCGSFDELRTHIKSQYDLELYDSADKLDFESTKSAVDGAVCVLQDIPGIQNEYQLFGIGKQASFIENGSACYTPGNINLNGQIFSSAAAVDKRCKEQSGNGWWVQNASAKSIGAHEAAHHLERVLTELNPDIPGYRRNAAFNDHQEAKNVVRSALRGLSRKTGKSEIALREEISGQSGISYAETMADAFADCVTNGSNAKEQSREIRRVTLHRIERFQRKED